MRRHGVLRDLQKPGYFACGNSVGFSARQKAKRLQPGGLSESGEATDGVDLFHKSSFANIYDGFKTADIF